MGSRSIRKCYQWSGSFQNDLQRKRLNWHVEDPCRLEKLEELASETAFVKALLTLAMEAIDDPIKSERLFELLAKEMAQNRR